MYNEVPGVGRKNVGPATVVSIVQDSTNEIVLTQMLVNGIHSLCCVIVCADGERRRSCMSFTCDSMSEISGDTMTTLELHNGCRLFKSKHSGLSSKTRLFPKPVGRFTTVSLPDRTNESACCCCGSMLMSALPMCCRESRIVEERLSLSWSLSNAIFLYNMEQKVHTYYYATKVMNTVDQHLLILRN